MKYNNWHKGIFKFLRIFAGPIIKLITRYECKRITPLESPCIILSNHNTDIDPALVGLSFSDHMYFVASEHAMRKGIASRVLQFCFDPIPINKTYADTAVVREILKRLKAGYHVCMFAEGNRSFNGVTGSISTATAKLVKLSGAALVTFRLEGGYFTSPRWGKGLRKGRMVGGVVNTYDPVTLKSMSNEEVLNAIERDIHEDAYAELKKNPIRYRGKNLAEHLETALYICPQCEEIGALKSQGDILSCKCGLRVKYLDTCLLEGINLPFQNITEWDIWQTEKLAEIIANSGNNPICEDEAQHLYEVKSALTSELLIKGTLSISREELICGEYVFPLEQITRIAIADRMTLLFSVHDGRQFEVKSSYPRSAVKYSETLRILRAHFCA